MFSMGARGPKKKLPVIEKLEGKPGRRPVLEAMVEAYGEPFVAEHLMDDARGCIEVIKASMPPNVYSRLDSFHLAAFGMAWAVHKRAALEISNPLFEWITDNGKPHGWLRILNDQAAKLATLGDRLGLDPKSRAALRLPNAEQKDEWDELMSPETRSGQSASFNS
jgi:phage terminase small subunit